MTLKMPSGEYAYLYHNACIELDIDASCRLKEIYKIISDATGIPIAAQHQIERHTYNIMDAYERLEWFMRQGGSDLELICKDGHFPDWDLAKAPYYAIILLRDFLNAVSTLSDPEKVVDQVLTIYHNTVFLSLPPKLSILELSTKELTDSIVAATKTLLSLHVDPTLVHFLTGVFLQDHHLNYSTLIAIYQDDILLGEHDPVNSAAVIAFKKQLIHLTEDRHYKRFTELALDELFQGFKKNNAFSRRPAGKAQIQYYGDQLRKSGKYPHLRLFAVEPNEIYPLIKFSQKNNVGKIPYRFQLIVAENHFNEAFRHFTCIDVKLLADHSISLCILDSVSTIERIFPNLKQVHQLGARVFHFVSIVPWPREQFAPAKQMQMRSDLYKCGRFAVHLAIQASIMEQLHEIAHDDVLESIFMKTLDPQPLLARIQAKREALGAYYAVYSAVYSDETWLHMRPWSQLPVSFLKYAQSPTFFQGHHPEEKFPAEEAGVDPLTFISRIDTKIKKYTAKVATAEELTSYLKGPMRRQQDFMEQPTAAQKPSIESAMVTARAPLTTSPSAKAEGPSTKIEQCQLKDGPSTFVEGDVRCEQLPAMDEFKSAVPGLNNISFLSQQSRRPHRIKTETSILSTCRLC
jgi:hypothetical protein